MSVGGILRLQTDRAPNGGSASPSPAADKRRSIQIEAKRNVSCALFDDDEDLASLRRRNSSSSSGASAVDRAVASLDPWTALEATGSLFAQREASKALIRDELHRASFDGGSRPPPASRNSPSFSEHARSRASLDLPRHGIAQSALSRDRLARRSMQFSPDRGFDSSRRPALAHIPAQSEETQPPRNVSVPAGDAFASASARSCSETRGEPGTRSARTRLSIDRDRVASASMPTVRMSNETTSEYTYGKPKSVKERKNEKKLKYRLLSWLGLK